MSRMREIKFRAWDGEKMIETGVLHDTTRGGYEMWDGDKHEYFPVMQYTGLKDKKGKEIYEGDVVKYYGGQGEVKFGEYMAGGQDYYASYAYGFYIRKSKFEDDTESLGDVLMIIGNIYENPDLLKS